MAMVTAATPSLIDGLTILTELNNLCADQDPDKLSGALRSAFTKRELYKMYLSFLVEDQERVKVLLEVFDKALTATQSDSQIFKKFRQLCGRTGLLPASHMILGSLIKTRDHPIASGAFGDVWEGIYAGNRVAIKSLRVYRDDDVRKARKLFCKEVVMWRKISHPNIVPLLGVSEAPAPISMVSEWMPNGDVRSYVEKNPEVSRLQLLLDISRGLSFLHSHEIVHGDLKGANILVDKSGRARINDFGLTIIASLNCTETSASSGGTYRWMAPELLGLEQNPNKRCLPTPQSDAFALGMVAIEVFTGQVPFPELTRPFAVTKKLVDGERPPRPPKASKLGLSNELWAAVQSLWAQEPGDRPPLDTFVDLLERVNPDMGLLEELKEFDANSDEHIAKLDYMLQYGDNALFGMREDESLVLIELFDRVLNSSLVDGNIRGRCLRGLQKVSARCGLLPKSYWIAQDSLAQSDEALCATGRVSGTCKRSLNGKSVAVKRIHLDCVGSCNTFQQRLCTNAVMWKRLRHPNVVSFLGLVSGSPPSSLVYPWMPNGTLSEYLRKHPDVDRLRLLIDVARGLTYLHQYNLVHGNLTGNNVLVDTNGVACLSEYGLELVLREEASSRSTLANVRWMAPEVLSTEKKNKRVSVEDVKRADVYSLAMVMFEILTGTAPLQDESDEVVLKEVITGLRPEWPSDAPSQALIDALRNQVEACWCYDPEERPSAHMALQSLQTFAQEREQERPQETQHLLEEGDDDSWDYLDDAAEVASKPHKGRREYLHLHLSGSTLVHESINRIREVFPHHGDSSTSSRDPTQGRRAKVKKGVRHLLHLAKPGLTTPEVVESHKSETEIVDKREETVQISDGSVSYLTSQPIPNGKKVKKVVITVDSKDQGWSSFQDDHGTYNNSWTWFELSVGPPSDGSVERWRGEVVRNLHAHGEFKKHTIEILDKGLYEKAKGGDVLTVSSHARYPGWKNTVKKIKIKCVVV